jgi:hypothetical protein
MFFLLSSNPHSLRASVPPILGDYSLGRILFGFYGSPLMTPEFIQACERIDLGVNSEFYQIKSHTFLLMSSFFLPFEPQWVQTASLTKAIYDEGFSLLSVIQSESLSLPQTFRNNSLILHRYLIQKVRWNDLQSGTRPVHLAEVQHIQSLPYSRDNYVVSEFLRRGDPSIPDFKRVISMARAPGGTWMRHMVFFTTGESLSEEALEGVFLRERDIFLRQNSQIKYLVNKSLSSSYQASF